MSDSIPGVTQVGGLIPNFWFDAIGRIVPGLFLMGGALEEVTYTAGCVLLQLDSLKSFSTAQATAGFLLLIVAAYLTGFLLGALSDLVVVGFWDLANPLPPLETRVLQVLTRTFGSDWSPPKGNNVIRARDLCSFLIWDRNPILAVIFSRWDAEALASRSIFLASLLVPIGSLLLNHSLRGKWFYLFYLTVAVLSGLSFSYYRRRALAARFQMLLVLQRGVDVKPSIGS